MPIPETIKVDEVELTQVTSDQWAEYLANVQCCGSEPSKDIMHHHRCRWEGDKCIQGELIGRIDYSGSEKTYWVKFG